MLEPGDREFTRLVDWVEGRLSEEEARSVEKQVDADSAMRADVAWLRAFNLISKDIVIASTPPEVRDTLLESFRGYAERKRRTGTLKKFVAQLSFDGGPQSAPGLRAISTPGPQRDFVYCSEVADVAVSVRLRSHDGLWDFEGQIFPLDGTNPGAFGVHLLGGPSEAAATTTNDLGEFSFEAVAPGTYEVLASTDQVEIGLEGVEVGQRR